jgi:hemoglobin
MEQSLYDKYGGAGTVSKIIHGLYKRVLESDLLAPYFEKVDMVRLINHQVRFFSALLGGAASYDDKPLVEIHQRLNITAAAFDEVMELMDDVLDESGFADDDKRAILDALNRYRSGFVAGRRKSAVVPERPARKL